MIDRKGKADLTLSRSYQPGAVDVGTTSQPWTYNAANMLATIPGYVTAASYEADGQTKSITYANGAATTFTYLPQRDWLTRVTTKSGSTTHLDNQYTRDKKGRITGINVLATSDDWTYTYDEMDRLLSATNAGNASLTETYTYSPTGNLLSRTKMGTYTYPSGSAVRPHAATKIGSRSLGYDANGNMLTDGSRTLTWGAANQLAEVAEAGSSVTFAYGPDGARVKKTWGFGTTLYAGADVEIDATTAGAEAYTLYPHPDIKITASASAQTGKDFLHRDHLASVRVVTNEAGAVAEKTGYAAYGEPTNQAMATKKGYIGERFDAETGLMYLNARYYDPAFGRFVPPDDQEARSSLEQQTEALFDPSLDLLDVKLAVDAMVDPSVDVVASRAAIEKMGDKVRAMAGTNADDGARLQALRRYIYEAGDWNDNRPFQYDLEDPLGARPENRILKNYLNFRRGNCITMPILFLTLGQQLGLDMTLAEAPLHVFVKYTDPARTIWNLEATSGGGVVRDEWYRKQLPMSDKAVANGIYLKQLSHQESVAVLASSLIEHEISEGRFQRAIRITEAILRHYPNFAYGLVKLGTAYAGLIRSELAGKYTRREDIPGAVLVKVDQWYANNVQAFAKAEALGWRPEDGQVQ